MSKVIAVFGAGTGLGVSVARRFGREGYRVALIARREQQLNDLVETLGAEGIEAAAFPADLRDTARVPALVAAITDRLGQIDVVEYAPITTEFFRPAAELAAADFAPLVSLYLYTPVEVVRAVLPGMLARGDGAILVGQGPTAVHAIPFRSGFGPAMAAGRNYFGSLHGEVADQGVYVGALTISALIAGSAGHRLVTSGEVETGLDLSRIQTVDPADLADLLWTMTIKRDQAEATFPVSR